MAEVGECGAWADSTTPEWAQGGKVTCGRPDGGRQGHAGPHSARATGPESPRPITLTWVQDARPATDDQPEPATELASDDEVIDDTVLSDATVDVRDLLVDALASGRAQIEAHVLGHEDAEGNFVVDEVLKLDGIRFRS